MSQPVIMSRGFSSVPRTRTSDSVGRRMTQCIMWGVIPVPFSESTACSVTPCSRSTTKARCELMCRMA